MLDQYYSTGGQLLFIENEHIAQVRYFKALPEQPGQAQHIQCFEQVQQEPREDYGE